VTSKGPTRWGRVIAVAAVVACCILLPAVALSAGLASAAAGVAVRYLPLAIAGTALVVWGGVALARAARRRQARRARQKMTADRGDLPSSWPGLSGVNSRRGRPLRPRAVVSERHELGVRRRGGVMPQEIEIDEIRELLATGAQLVEVLPPAEFDEEHLPGAINIPLKQLTEQATASLDRERPVIVYCWDYQ